MIGDQVTAGEFEYVSGHLLTPEQDAVQLLVILEKEAARLDRVLAGVLALAAPPRYPSACQIAPLLDDARDLEASLLSKLNAEAIGPEVVARIAPVRKFVADPRTIRAHAIATFISAELDRWKDFFDTIESKPLTPEQRLSVVVDEDGTLVLAGAGSGKTSVITAKAAYLVKAGIRQPEEIIKSLNQVTKDEIKTLSQETKKLLQSTSAIICIYL
jgi:DNA helicase-4